MPGHLWSQPVHWLVERNLVGGWQWSRSGLFLDCTASSTGSDWSIGLSVARLNCAQCPPHGRMFVHHLRLIDQWPPVFTVYWQLCTCKVDFGPSTIVRVQNSFIWNLRQLCALIRTSPYLPKMRKFMMYVCNGDGCAWNQSGSKSFHDNDSLK